MNATDLAVQLTRAAPGSEIRVGAGEFEGPWTVDVPVRLVGVGPATVLWAKHGPVLSVRAAGVSVENLSVEALGGAGTVAIELTGAAVTQPASFSGVRVIGAVTGLGAGPAWTPPAVIDLGGLPENSSYRKVCRFQAPQPVTAQTQLTGLRVRTQSTGADQAGLQLDFSSQGLMAGSEIEGQIDILIGGLVCPARVIGRIESRGSRAPVSDPPLGQGARTPRMAAPLSTAHGPVASAPLGALPQPPAPSASEAPRPHRAPTTAPAATPSLAEPDPEANEVAWSVFLREEAHRSAERNDPERAIDLLVQVLKLEPDSADVRADLARLYTRRGFVEGAAAEWERVFAGQPAYPHAAIEIARCYNQLGRYPDTIVLLERAARTPLGSRPVDIYGALAMAYFHGARLDEALWALARVIELNPGDAKTKALYQVWSRQKSRSDHG